MSGTFPTTVPISSVTQKVNTPTLVTRTLSGLTRRVGMGHSYYSFVVNFDNLTRYDAGPLLGFVAQQYGPLESFQIELPELSYSKTTNQTSGAILTNGAVSAGADSVAVTGVATGKELLRAGDFFKFGNHSKVYQCAVTWTTGQPLYFSGSLVADVPNGTGITIGRSTDPVLFTCVLENDVQQWDTGVGGFVNMSLEMREVW